MLTPCDHRCLGGVPDFFDLDGGILRATGNESNFLADFASGDVTLEAGGGFIDTNGFNIGILANLDGTGRFTKQGNGTLILSGTNTYSGGTAVEAGTLTSAAAGAFPSNTAYIVNGGTLNLNSRALTASSLSGTGGAIVLGSATLTVNQSIDTAFAGVISGSTARLVKTGAGTLSLSGNDTFGGGTTISGGKLLLDNGSLSGAGAVSVQTAGTLGGNGTIAGSTAIDGTIAPGLSAGLLTFSGSLTLNTGSFTLIELGGLDAASFDRISVGGALAYGGTLNVSFLNGFTPAVGNSFQLFKDFTSQSGSFSNISFANSSYAGNFNYSTGTLSITAVPEPSACAADVVIAMLGICCAAARSADKSPVATDNPHDITNNSLPAHRLFG